MTKDTFTVEILVFDGFDELDGVGPFEVFESAAGDVGTTAPVAASMVTVEPGHARSSGSFPAAPSGRP